MIQVRSEIPLNEMTVDGLKQLALVQYSFAIGCLRASAAEFDALDDSQTYLDAPDYFEEIFNAVEQIREIHREVRRRSQCPIQH